MNFKKQLERANYKENIKHLVHEIREKITLYEKALKTEDPLGKWHAYYRGCIDTFDWVLGQLWVVLGEKNDKL